MSLVSIVQDLFISCFICLSKRMSYFVTFVDSFSVNPVFSVSFFIISILTISMLDCIISSSFPISFWWQESHLSAQVHMGGQAWLGGQAGLTSSSCSQQFTIPNNSRQSTSNNTFIKVLLCFLTHSVEQNVGLDSSSIGYLFLSFSPRFCMPIAYV